VPDLVGLTIADEPAAWTEIGFAVSRAAFVLGGVTVEVVGRDEGGGSGGRSSTRTRSAVRGGVNGGDEDGWVRDGAPLGPGGGCGAV
jgi:hypothetical protein